MFEQSTVIKLRKNINTNL